MESKKGINLFFAFIAFILGWTLFKHFDFKTLSLKDPVLDILYIIVFVVSIYLIIKDYRKNKKTAANNH
jgi:nicotinamide riboside transporter PnuC